VLTCPRCRSPLEVPADHAGASIRCGICWAESPVPPHDEPEAEVFDEPLVLVQGDVFASVGGRPAKGMAPLEDLLRRVAARVPQLLRATPPEPVLLKASGVVKARPAIRSRVEEGLRRPRGSSIQIPIHPAVPVGKPRSSLWIVLLGTLLLFVLAYLLARQFIR